MSAVEDTIFRGGSTTYYWGAKFFPRHVRGDVLRLYSFLRVADDYVDHVPPQSRPFHMLRTAWDHAKDDAHFETDPAPDDTVDERVIKNIVGLTRTYAFDDAWIEAFWDAMQADLDSRAYKTLADSLGYVYGSAEVVGLMMAKLMGLSPEAYETAKMQGRAMQWINFIRDLKEDLERSRCYFPHEDLQRCGLGTLDEAVARAHPAAFKRFMRLELDRYHEWQAAADRGMHFMPGMLQTGLKTAVDMYNWTAAQIAKDPFVVFDRQVRPTKSQVLARGIKNLFV
jgi:15-cis-phytoene synthase